MGSTSDFGNVFYTDYDNVLSFYRNAKNIEVWDSHKVIALADTDSNLGLFDKSDIIVFYGEDDLPVLISERIHKSNYSKLKWLRVRLSLLNRVHTFKEELGYKIGLSCSENYLDFLHYKSDTLTLDNLPSLIGRSVTNGAEK